MSAPPAPHPGDPLTDREIEILYWTARGLRNAGVADHLFLTTDTVKTHLRRIFTKLDAHDRAHVVTRGFNDGYLWFDTTGRMRCGRPDTLRVVA